MPGDVVIAWVGDVGLSSLDRVGADIDSALQTSGVRRLIMDFGGVGFVEPVAIRILLGARNRCTGHDVDIVLRSMPRNAKRLLAMTGLTDLFSYEDPPPVPAEPTSLPRHTPLSATPDDEFDQLTALAAQLLGVSTALVTLVDRDQQVMPGAAGLPTPWQERRSTPLSHSFCKHVVDRAAPLIVEDADMDPMFADNPAIADLGVVAYAGMPLTDVDGRVVGALCAIDSLPHPWTAEELSALHDLAAVCSAALRLRTLARRAAPPACS